MSLFHESAAGEATTVGVECHIVPRRDDPNVPRSPGLLTDSERTRWSSLIEDRHCYANLILLCATHHLVIDDPSQGFSIADLVAMKEAHVESVRNAVRQRQSTGDNHLDLGSDALGQINLDLPEDPTQWSLRSRLEVQRSDPEGAAWLRGVIGDQPSRSQVAALVEEWPARIYSGSNELQVLLIREAEALGLWKEASRGWIKTAEALPDQGKADRLVRAAIDASVAGDSHERHRLLEEAEKLDPDCPRLQLERLDDDAPGEEQIEYLLGIRTPEDPKLESLMQASLCRAYLLVSDFENASIALERAEHLEAGTVAARICRVNFEIQKARIAMLEDREFDLNLLLDSRDRALELRDELIGAGRWEESLRLLMLAGDVLALLKDLDAAREILSVAREEEIIQADGPEVLGEAALRVGAPELTLQFLRGSQSTPAIERIRAAADLDLNPRNEGALQTLEDLARSEGEEGSHAAAFRVMASLPPVLAPWHEPSAARLEGTEQENMMRTVRTLSAVSHDPDRAKTLASELPSEAWAAEVRVRVALATQDQERMAAAAAEFLAFAPDQAGKILAAEALLQCGDLQNARIHAAQVAQSIHAPPKVRFDAFDLLLRALARLGEWDAALRAWESWRDLSVSEGDFEGRLSAWQVRVYNRN
jgi:tetratricopeptide (TPR) repeat protein